MSDKLTIKYMDVEALIPYANNSRTHSDEQVNQLANSISEWGFTNPILIDENGIIIAGHGRLLAAQKVGLMQVPTIELKDLTEAQKRAYIIADNKLALNAGWDNELLLAEMEELRKVDFGLELTGFTEDDLKLLDPIDYSILDELGDDFEEKLAEMEGGVKKAIQIEFEQEDYETAQELVKFWRGMGAYIGSMVIEKLRVEKERL